MQRRLLIFRESANASLAYPCGGWLFKARWRIESMFGELKEHLGLRLVARCKTLATLQTVIASALLVCTLNRTL